MSKFAQLHSGETLEFPDDTEDSVIDQTVKRLHYQQNMEPHDYGASEENTMGRAIGENVAGGAMAAGDIVGGIPGFIGSAAMGASQLAAKAPAQMNTGLLGLGGKIMAQRMGAGELNPMQIMEGTKEAMGASMPSQIAKNQFGMNTDPLTESGGYHNMMLPIDALSQIPQGHGNIAGALTRFGGGSYESAGQAGAVADVSSMALLAASGLGRKGPPGVDPMAKALNEAKMAKAKRDAETIQKAREGGEQADMFTNLPTGEEAYQQGMTMRGGRMGGILDENRRKEIEQELGTDHQGGLYDPAQRDLFEGDRQTPPELLQNIPPRRTGGSIDYEVDNRGSTPQGQMALNMEGRQATRGGAGEAFDRGIPYERVSVSDLSRREREIDQAFNERDANKRQGVDEAYRQRDAAKAAEDHARMINQLDKIEEQLRRGDSKGVGPQNIKTNLGKSGRQRGIVEFDYVSPFIKPEIRKAIERAVIEINNRWPRFSARTPNIAIVGADKMRELMGRKPNEVVEQGLFKHSEHKIYINVETINQMGVMNIKRLLLHELTHGWQKSEGRLGGAHSTWRNAEKFSNETKKPWAERSHEQEAEKIAQSATRWGPGHGYEWIKGQEPGLRGMKDAIGRKYPYSNIGGVPVRGMRKQKGSIELETTFGEFMRKLKEQGTDLPEEVAKAIFEENFRKPKEPHIRGSEHEDAVTTISKVKGFGKLKELLNYEGNIDKLAEDLKTPGLKDISKAKRVTLKTIQPKKYAAAEHIATRFASSKIDQARDIASQAADDLLIGEQQGRVKKPMPGSAMYLWKDMKDASKNVLNRIGQALTNERVASTAEAINAKAKELFGRELTENEMQAYNDRHKGMQQLLKAVNGYLTAIGRDPLPEMPTFWSPAEWGGDYLYFIRDPRTKEILHVQGTHFRPDSFLGKVFNRELNKQLKELGMDVQTDRYIRKDAPKDVDFLQLETMIQALGQRSERGQLIRKSINDIIARISYKKHGMHREGHEGYLGSEKNDKTALRNYEQVYEETVRKAFNFIANRKMDKLYADLEGLKELEQFPQARKQALEMVDTARGGYNKFFKAVDTFSRDLLDTFGIPPSMAQTLVRKSGQSMTQLLLSFWQLSQIGAQFTQHLFAIPAMQAKLAESGMGVFHRQAAVFTAVSKAYGDILYETKRAEKDINELAKIGTFEPGFRFDYIDYNYEALSSKVQKGYEHMSGQSTLAYIESRVVRRPAALMFLHMLREGGYKGGDIYTMAKQLTDSYMVSSKRHEKAPVLNRGGLVSDVISPLQSFPTTWLAQFSEYLGHAKDGKPDPLLSFLGMNIATAGLMGFVGVKEWDTLVGFTNDKGWTDWQTGTETILKIANKTGKYGDLLAFGAISKATGMNYGATMNAPTLTGTAAPGVQLMANLLDAGAVGSKYAASKVGNRPDWEPTDVEKRDALKGISPRTLHGAIEKTYQQPDEPYQDTKNRGHVFRDEKDWRARHLGTFTIPEVREKAATYQAERKDRELQHQKTTFIPRLADHLVKGGEFDERWVKQAEKLQYTGGEVVQNLRREIKERLETRIERDVKTGRTNRQARLYQVYEELGGGRDD